MTPQPVAWRPGRGKLGPLAPLIGSWTATTDSPMGPVTCTRTFTSVLGGKFVQLEAVWRLPDRSYTELAIFGVNDTGEMGFWSFTSDGKRSIGARADASDVHPLAVGFEAQMPAGLARQAYWPDANEGFRWAVESRSKKGWNRFTEHHYTAVR